ncbi:MAG TPA: molecular chaperone TorD family protein [Burkholderiales bacterium]
MSAGGDLQERGPLAEEDAARANLYALIGRLFYDAPDSILLAQLRRGEGEPSGSSQPLDQAWSALRDACGSAYPVVVKQEYDTLFIGVGRSEVTPYTTHYLKGHSPEQHLVRLRERLGSLGLGRRDAAYEMEDHVSGLCDVMRVLIEEGHALSEQMQFFNEFVYPCVKPFCDAVGTATSAVFYRHVAQFLGAFLEVERQAFEMIEPGG